MNRSFQRITEGILRLDIPFDSLYTSVFLIPGEHPILIDSATTKDDVEGIILPALAACGINRDTEGELVVTHRHGDHNGGTEHLLAALPRFRFRALQAGERLGALEAVPLGGHTLDSMGYFDTRTRTLMTGDGLQFFGVGKYGCSIVDATVYEQTLARVRALAPDSLLPSHAFVGGTAQALGKETAARVIDAAFAVWEDLKRFVREGDGDVEALAQAFRAQHPNLPPLPRITIKAILAAK